MVSRIIMLLGAWRLHEQRPIINYRPLSKTRASSYLALLARSQIKVVECLSFDVFPRALCDSSIYQNTHPRESTKRKSEPMWVSMLYLKVRA